MKFQCRSSTTNYIRSQYASRKTNSIPRAFVFQSDMQVRDKILSGTWGYGYRIAGEIELARQIGVSVITIRQALAHLCQEKLLTREWRKGTFVSWRGPLKKSVQLEIETEVLAPVDAEGTSFKVLNLEDVKATSDLSRDFGLSVNDKVRKIERIRMSHRRPLAYVIRICRCELPLNYGLRVSKSYRCPPSLRNPWVSKSAT